MAMMAVGTMAKLLLSQASGNPINKPEVADNPAQIHSSSAVNPRTTTG
jgi:hypothetical protein